MFFYCTSKINNYYKVGIAESISRIKKRLTTYRSTHPETTIKLFSELGDPYNIEWSFKNKFSDFRVGKSECYKVKFNIIYKHFLKYQHKSNLLHQHWNYNELFLSEYYFNKQVPDHEYALSERQQREHMFDGFIPVAYFSRSNEQVKKDKFKYKIIYLDINKVDLREYKSKYKKHLKEKWYGQQRGFANSELQKFYKENFKLKKIVKGENESYAQQPISEIIFKNFEKKYKNLVKKYQSNKDGVRYYEQSSQKSITGVKSFKFINKIEGKFSESYDDGVILSEIKKLLIKRSNHPLNYLPILYNILCSTSHRAPKEIRGSLDKLETELIGLIQKFKDNELDKELNQQKGKNVINFLKNVSKHKKNERTKS